MSTWMEFDRLPPPPRAPAQPASRACSFTAHWKSFNDRRGTGMQSFVQRLSRARLLYLRRDDNSANWLALSLLFCLGAQVLPMHDTSPGAEEEMAPGTSLHGDTQAFRANFNPESGVHRTEGNEHV